MLEALFGGIIAVAAVAQAVTSRRLEQRDKALLALYAALTETREYLVERQKGRDTVREKRLAELWFASSVPLRHFDKRLAGLCEHKRDYWSNPTRWVGDDRINTAIRLDAMGNRFDEIKQSVLTAFISRPAVVKRTRVKPTKRNGRAKPVA